MTEVLQPVRRHPYGVLAVACAALATGLAGLAWQWATDQPHPYYEVVSLTVFTLAYGVVGAFLTARVPTNDTGPWMLLCATFTGLQAMFGIVALSIGSGGWRVAVFGGLFAVCRLLGSSGAFVLMLLLAPTGRPLSRRWGRFIQVWAVIIGLGAVAVFFGGPGDGLSGYPVETNLLPRALYGTYWLFIFTNWFSLVGVAAGLVCLALRVRRSQGVERQQVLWVVTAGAAGPLLVLGFGLATSRFHLQESSVITLIGEVLFALCLPLGIAVAVTRHGLYDLGRIVSRTFSYAVVTGLVLAIYAVTVTLLSRLVPGSSSFAVAAATLVAAAASQPLLRRVRRVIDRRFDRAHYDAARVVEQFGHGLRSAVDTDQVTDELLDVLRRTVLPATASVTTFDRRTDSLG